MGRISRLVVGLMIVVGAIGAQGASISLAQPVESGQQVCRSSEPSTETLSGATLVYTGSFHCAAANGTFSLTVDVSSDDESEGMVTIDNLVLTHTTPKPRGQAAEAAVQPQGLPLTLEPGQRGSFTVTGTYALIETGRGGKGKANLHLQAEGASAAGEQPFELGLNVHLRTANSSDQDDGGDQDERGGGPPDWVPGPPPWVDDRRPHGR